MNTQINKLFFIVGAHIVAIFVANSFFSFIEQRLDIVVMSITAGALFVLTIGVSWTSWKCLCHFTEFGNTSIATWIPCAILLVAIHAMCHSFGIEHVVLNILTVAGILASIYKANPIHIPSQE